MAAKDNPDDARPCSSTGDADEPSYRDFICVICLQLLIEPVVLPCKHELCMLCFKTHVHSTSLCCPMCRARISSWARRKSREGSLIDEERWNYIQKLFPERCQKRMNGEEDDDDDDFLSPPFTHVVAKEGALREEYEIERKKIEQERAEEIQASEEVIQLILKEEEALRKDVEEDEKLAKQLQQEELKTAGNNVLSLNSKLRQVLDVFKLPKEMTLRSSSTSEKKDTSDDTKSKKCMSNWLSKSQQDHDRHPLGNNSNNTPHRSRQEEEDYHVAFRLQRELDQERKRPTTPKSVNEFFNPLRKDTLSKSAEPPSKRLKNR